jgi:PRTRC genetic system ThiF family protein
MKAIKKAVHFTDKYVLQPTNPITVNLTGVGGTGSQMLTALARISHSLIQLGHPGLYVRVFDDDAVSHANLGRQLFAASELGLNKGVALVNRINRFFGTNWKAVPVKYDKKQKAPANITISCVDTVRARYDIAEALTAFEQEESRDKPLYWMDMGNSRYTGQVLLSTVHPIPQPASKKFIPVQYLPMITDEFKGLLEQQQDSNGPSCSLAEALEKQDLFINSALANTGASLLWQLFRKGMTANRGFFLNLEDFRMQPLKVL